ncbi:hypothetical protein JCM10450v2_007138 [Rhodotorula kratochvilovae]
MSTAPAAVPLRASTAPPPMGESVVLRPKAGTPHNGTVIWSHGLGDTANGWLSFANALRTVDGLQGVKWVLTNAPKRYDIPRPAAPPAEEDTEGMAASVEQLTGLIDAEVDEAGIEEGRIVVGGFSQGGVLSLLTGLTSPRQLGGACVLSGFLGLMHNDKIKTHLSPHARTTPILWAHGTADAMIAYSRAQSGRKYLIEELGLEEGEGRLETRAYEGMGHQLGAAEFEEVREWLVKRFA